VDLADLLRVASEYLLPLFCPETSNGVVVLPPDKAEYVMEKYRKDRFKPVVEELHLEDETDSSESSDSVSFDPMDL
jgi:hypothetical protein